jgi:peroxiredoxin
VFAISRDTIYSHRAWREVLDLNFPLLSDWNGDAVRACGVATDMNGMRGAPVRSAFLLGRDGMIRQAWRYEPREVPDVEELLAAARLLS